MVLLLDVLSVVVAVALVVGGMTLARRIGPGGAGRPRLRELREVRRAHEQRDDDARG